MEFTQFITALATNGIGAMCAGAILWLAWWRETKSLPQIMSTFADVHTQDRLAYTSAHRDDMANFQTIITEERRICQRWHEENRSRLETLALDLKEQRHLIANLAYQAGLKKALAETKIQAECKEDIEK